MFGQVPSPNGFAAIIRKRTRVPLGPLPPVRTGEITHEDRYLNAMWPQISQVHDLHFGPAQGTFFTRANPLTLDTRFGAKLPNKKKPQV